MPVLVEVISEPSSQDLLDLQKIYQDAPDWLLTPFANRNQLIEHGIAQHQLLAGRFNDRLLAAAIVEKGQACWRLSHLCVRNVTRQRGVARRLLAEAQRLAREAGKPLHLAAPQDHLESQALAARTGLPLQAL
ncbi:GNAT superfamily N-acetyltransferase [Pseudomonas sp. TE3786]